MGVCEEACEGGCFVYSAFLASMLGSTHAGFGARLNAQPGELNGIYRAHISWVSVLPATITADACGKIAVVHGGAASKAFDVLWFTTTATWGFKLSAGSSSRCGGERGKRRRCARRLGLPLSWLHNHAPALFYVRRPTHGTSGALDLVH